MIRVSEDLRPMTDLKSQAADVVRQAVDSGRPVVLTRHGRGVAVVLSVEAYDELAAAAGVEAIRSAVRAADAAVAAGRTASHDDVAHRIRERMARDGA